VCDAIFCLLEQLAAIVLALIEPASDFDPAHVTALEAERA